MEERDLGIIFRNYLKPSSQCSSAASKGTSVMGLMKKNFKNLDSDRFLILYKAYIRPHLGYCVSLLEKDIQLLEKVQRKSTKIVQGLKTLSYNQRLEKLGLTTLEKRRERGYLIEAYKLLTGK
jgi:ribonucleases P/MRP protein subunit RPP40